MVGYVSQNEEGKWDVWIDGRQNYEVKNQSKQSASARAREIIRNSGEGGDIIYQSDEGQSTEHVSD
ncbi:MAG: hypothetical protein IJ717_06670 [Treponema sp.]|uniref:hypothetical protein n=1 Tax=Treponema saccharophilum TaxID=165 RepID=UPI001B548502|nr:hypothetical protein [Treponema sp.]MBR1714607.1 hypothetical protein [Treponema sp.]